MSGIVGVLYRDGRSVEDRELERMLGSIAWRGLDGRGSWHAGPVGLGHLLLRVTPESRQERQPVILDQLAITADARLDNRRELLAQLGGRAPAEVTDVELILRAYQRWGADCVQHLLGDFAFALWDERRHELFCARDHFGVRPFLYYVGRRSFVFGSQAAALLALPDVPRRVSEEFVASYISARFADPALTAYRDLYRLPAAHTLTVDADGVHLRRYWALDPQREIRLRSDAEYEEAFRDIFFAAVACRLRSAFPVGSALSGGLDSSSIACVARRLLPADRPLHTFSLLFPRFPDVDERAFIDAVLRQGGFESHLIDGDDVSPFIDLERQIEAQSEPSVAPNLFLHWAMYGAARAVGVRVFLDGFDGDSTVSYGVQRLTELFWQGRWLASWREGRALRARAGTGPWHRLVAGEVRAAMPEPFQAAYRSVRRRPVSATATPTPAVGLKPQLMAESPSSGRRPVRSERLAHRDWLLNPLLTIGLEVANRAAAAHGVESLHPFFDRRLVEFCLALPADQKLRGGWTRSILRRSMERILPPAVQWRSDKSDLGPILPDVLLRFEGARVARALESEVLDPFADWDALDAIRERFCRERAPLDSVIAWRWVSLALWLERERGRASAAAMRECTPVQEGEH